MWMHGAQAAVVAVNPKTGRVHVKKVGAAHDVGKAINPTGCLQQIEGSIIMGLGHALMEEMIYEDGKLRNGNMVDYKVPTFMDNPNNEHVKVDFVGEPFATGPNGAKGIGEVAMIPVMAAVANAINAAAGAEIHNIPMTRERVLQALRDKEAADKK